MPLPPLRFEPLFTNNLWGGCRLPALLGRPAPSDDPIGEAWVLSDVDGSSSRVNGGPLAGRTLRELLANRPERILGTAKLSNGRFPLLLKFIDARHELSVQVHPNDEHAARTKPGAAGKTEAWVILEADPATSRIYAGFRHGVTAESFRTALANKTTPQTLHSFTPQPGECVFLPAGTVHAIGANILLFEVQQTSEITYRLYDWDRVDAKSGLPRELHVEHGLHVSNFASGPCSATPPERLDHPHAERERLATCEYFTLERWTGSQRFAVGGPGQCRVLVVLESDGPAALEWDGHAESLTNGNVILLPAERGECVVRPAGRVTLLECGLPS